MRSNLIPYFVWGLQLTLITLKLIGYINWEWWLVLLPVEIIGSILLLTYLLVLYGKLQVKKVKENPAYRDYVARKKMAKHDKK